MAVVSVTKNPKKNDQAVQTLNQQTQETDLQFIETYIVTFDTGFVPGALDCLGASDGSTTIPSIGASGGNGLSCTRVQPQRRADSLYVFDVQVEYKTSTPDSKDKNWDITISVKGVKYTQDAWYDALNSPVLNSAGQMFSPTIKRTQYDEEITVGFMTTQLNTAAIATARGQINAGSITMTVNGASRTFEGGCLLFQDAEYSMTINGKPPYPWKVQYSFIYRKPLTNPNNGQVANGFTTFVVDRGFFSLVDGKRVLVKDKYGEHHQEAVNLDSHGMPLAVGAQPKYLQFFLYPYGDFTSLLTGISQ